MKRITEHGLFSFAGADAMHRAIRLLRSHFPDIAFSLYRAYLGGYIMSLPLLDTDGISPADLVLEFGKREKDITAPPSPEWFEPLDSGEK